MRALDFSVFFSFLSSTSNILSSPLLLRMFTSHEVPRDSPSPGVLNIHTYIGSNEREGEGSRSKRKGCALFSKKVNVWGSAKRR